MSLVPRGYLGGSQRTDGGSMSEYDGPDQPSGEPADHSPPETDPLVGSGAGNVEPGPPVGSADVLPDVGADPTAVGPTWSASVSPGSPTAPPGDPGAASAG